MIELNLDFWQTATFMEKAVCVTWFIVTGCWFIVTGYVFLAGIYSTYLKRKESEEHRQKTDTLFQEMKPIASSPAKKPEALTTDVPAASDVHEHSTVVTENPQSKKGGPKCS